MASDLKQAVREDKSDDQRVRGNDGQNIGKGGIKPGRHAGHQINAMGVPDDHDLEDGQTRQGERQTTQTKYRWDEPSSGNGMGEQSPGAADDEPIKQNECDNDFIPPELGQEFTDRQELGHNGRESCGDNDSLYGMFRGVLQSIEPGR